jgi:hypothetical protein
MTTPAKQLGYSEGQVFRIIERECAGWEVGDIIRLRSDDATECPSFIHLTSQEQRYVMLRNIEPASPEAVASANSRTQQQAVTTFKTMLARAMAHRNGDNVEDSLFYTGYGICDNIERCMPEGSSSTIIALIKDNLIRRVPSYSGNYHYPVSCPETSGSEGADSAWSRHSNKWAGAYGQNRITQLNELIDMIENKWDDSFAQNMTPAVRVGIIPNITLCQFRDGTFWHLDTDDGSSDPYFRPVGGGDRRSQELRYVTIMPTVIDGKKRSVPAFLKEIAKQQAKRDKLQAQIAALQRLAAEANSKIAMLDYGLAQTHKVKRMDK